jgi:hypothetical protein
MVAASARMGWFHAGWFHGSLEGAGCVGGGCVVVCQSTGYTFSGSLSRIGVKICQQLVSRPDEAMPSGFCRNGW